MEEINKEDAIISLVSEEKGMRIVPQNDYELRIDKEEVFVVKKQVQYPKDYEECCDVLDINPVENYVVGYKDELFTKFQQLYICRAAYWKIAGDWKPDWEDNNTVYYAIKTCTCDISLISTLYIEDCILAFPTEEMRDTFYDNFKDLIESCKELL